MAPHKGERFAADGKFLHACGRGSAVFLQQFSKLPQLQHRRRIVKQKSQIANGEDEQQNGTEAAVLNADAGDRVIHMKPSPFNGFHPLPGAVRPLNATNRPLILIFWSIYVKESLENKCYERRQTMPQRALKASKLLVLLPLVHWPVEFLKWFSGGAEGGIKELSINSR